MKNEIYVVYCYYPLFSKMPKRRWVKFNSRQAAKDFVKEKIESRKDRFVWTYIVNNVEVDSL